MDNSANTTVRCPDCHGAGRLFHGGADCCGDGCCYSPCPRCQGKGVVSADDDTPAQPASRRA